VNGGEASDVISIHVIDTGIGIPAEKIPRIWEKFYRVDSSLTYEVSGVGIGLYLAKRIIELHHGTISVESELERGSRFTIRLPLSG
jgi:signal transduction histidine kinase